MSALEEFNAHRSWTKQRGQEYVRGDFSDAAINELLAKLAAAEAALYYDEDGDTAQTWQTRAEVLEAKLAATEAQVARAEWKLKRLRDEGVIKDDDLASLEAVFVEFHREPRP